MVLIISAHFLSTHVSVPMRLLFKHLQAHCHDRRFQFSLNVRSVQITGGRMLVQLKRHLRGLQLPFQSLSPSQYVQVPSRYQIDSFQLLQLQNASLAYMEHSISLFFCHWQYPNVHKLMEHQTNIRVVEMSMNDSWFRDMGPTVRHLNLCFLLLSSTVRCFGLLIVSLVFSLSPVKSSQESKNRQQQESIGNLMPGEVCFY